MKHLIIDIESVPAPIEQLETMMPESMRNPVMPAELVNPAKPDFGEPPKYAGIKDEAERKAKQDAWLTDKESKWNGEIEARRAAWQAKVAGDRISFIENAALHAERGQVKMIGIEEVGVGTMIYVGEPDPELAKKIRAEKVADGVTVQLFRTEKEMLAAALAFVKMKRFEVRNVQTNEIEEPKRWIEFGDGTREPVTTKEQVVTDDKIQIVTYYGNTFDFPFIARRAAILGSPDWFAFVIKNSRGRYLGDVFVDIHEKWQFGDRTVSTGGLDGLAKMLGVEQKTGDGASFYKWYRENPGEGIAYLLNDLRVTRQCAEKMGVIK